MILWTDRQGYIANSFKVCPRSIDRTNFGIQELTLFSLKWYSYKFLGAGAREETVISIGKVWIVWENGSFICGKWPVTKLFQSEIVQRFCANMKAAGNRECKQVLCAIPIGVPYEN